MVNVLVKDNIIFIHFNWYLPQIKQHLSHIIKYAQPDKTNSYVVLSFIFI